ncbi:MAG TPA: tRNA (N6-isopentenyl adenosine(37)-C2)-methylthiotransferase MiaB [Dongiaceae bacterium]|jgi:tRNA-2-methylthio-N6-dimethylallyladenosine synthase|nr:tRNA (N6-isopentenyl adenosine(37)-C2)-methylthiotransferase MiaB [Dongiaceae bacterium]
MTALKKLHIKTYGCQMNVYDSSRMADLLAPLGYGMTSDIAEADLVILNTCHIREHASEKVFSEIGRIDKMRQGRPPDGRDMIVAVAGCVAQAEGEEILRRMPAVDIVLGPQAYHRLPEHVAQAERLRDHRNGKRQGAGIIATDFPAEEKFDFLPEQTAASGVSAFLSIQEGCDKFCTFCVVPYTRGAEYSRPPARIRAEAERLVSLGAREIVLLGQNVNAYHGRAEDGCEWGLAALLRDLATLPGLARLRFTTSHPNDMDDDLIRAFGGIPSLMPALHLPVQSGSDRILRAMNRRHDRAHYEAIIARLREIRPDIALSSDFIVGFPGEREEDFQATLSLVEEIGFSQAYSFCYSPRPGTAAANDDAQIPEPVKQERLARLQEVLNRQQRECNAAQLGKILPVLVEKPGRQPGQLIGRTPYQQAVHFHGATTLIGSVCDIAITHLGQFSLGGEIRSGAEAA